MMHIFQKYKHFHVSPGCGNRLIRFLEYKATCTQYTVGEVVYQIQINLLYDIRLPFPVVH